MTFFIDPKQIDELQRRIVVDPEPPKTTTEVEHRGPKPNISDNGRLQQDNPPLRIMFNPNWTLAKSQIDEAMEKLARFMTPLDYVPYKADTENNSLDPEPFQDYPDPETKTIVVKGERSITGYTNYWLLENGEVVKSIIALTDEEADDKLNDNG